MLYSSLALAAIAAVATASPLTGVGPAKRQAESAQLYAVWTTSEWETTIDKGGEHNVVLNSGFNIVTANGQVLYSLSDIEGGAFCTTEGRQFEVDGGCFNGNHKFSCAANDAGDAGSCAVWGPDANLNDELEDCQEGNTGPSYSVFSARTKGQCVVGFTVEGDDCSTIVQDWSSTKTSDDTPPPCDTCPACN